MDLKSLLVASLILLASFAVAAEQAAQDATRGELLYTTHCVTCHSAQVHWRAKRLATDWKSLLAQVNRWQGISNLGWDNEDKASVARYLNHLYYSFPTLE